MSLQKRPDSSCCLHPETWSLPSGSHFSRHSRHPSRLDLDSFEDAAERRWCQIWASSPYLGHSFAAVQPVIRRNNLRRENAQPLWSQGARHWAEPPALNAHRPVCWLTASSGLRLKKQEKRWTFLRRESAHVALGGKWGGVMEHAVLYLPSNGTSFIRNTAAAAFRLISRFILPWPVLGLWWLQLRY